MQCSPDAPTEMLILMLLILNLWFIWGKKKEFHLATVALVSVPAGQPQRGT